MVYIKGIHIDGTRRPTNMPIQEHTIIDDWFEHKFGIKARSSTIFVGVTRESVNKYAQYNNCVVKKSHLLRTLNLYIA